MDPKWFGWRIRQARERKGMSQEDLAAAVSKDQGAISEYESGKRKLAATDLPLFATVLEVPLLYFFEPEMSADDLDAAILNYVHQLRTTEDQQVLVDVVRVVSNALQHKQP
ncbi:MAG: helix-turn-helix transcriptional regulator [Anaerolineae bacterium]|nr:helix-turn-helix transcriptional regulator [Anaerolineae bacterium]